MPDANTGAIQHHLWDLPSYRRGKYAVLVTVRRLAHEQTIKLSEQLIASAITTLFTRINPVEQTWQQLRDQFWANRCFKHYDEIVDVCCHAWNQFTSQGDAIRNLCSRRWAVLT